MCQLLCFEQDFKAFCIQFCKYSAPLIDFMNDKAINPAFQQLIDNMEGSRSPSFYFTGRSGGGKSSLINALANLPVAEVSGIEAVTGRSKQYSIDFVDGSSWKIFDSRGLAETLVPDQSIQEPVMRIKQQIADFKPDIILYTVSSKEIRNSLSEFNLLSTALYELQELLGFTPPVMVVITHADVLGKMSEWPPEYFLSKQTQLKELLISTATEFLKASGYSPVDKEDPYRGYSTTGKMPVRYLIPVALPQEGELWNIEVLTQMLGQLLPTEARFQYCQPQKRPYLMKEYSSRYIKYFSGAAVAVATIPVPGPEIVILTALQVLMVCVIANLSGRELSLKTATEFMGAMGLTYIAGQGCLRVTEEILKFVPVAGPLIAATVAGAGTYAMGKSAQAYFFDGKKRRPSEFRAPNAGIEWTRPLSITEEGSS